jgi:hypothetical protein
MSAEAKKDTWDGAPMPDEPSRRIIFMRREERLSANCSLCHSPAPAGVGLYLAPHMSIDDPHHYICEECIVRMRTVLA